MKLHLHLLAQIHDFLEVELDKPRLNSFDLGDFKAPKVLGDIVESIAGTNFLDKFLDIAKVWDVFQPLLQPMVTPETLPMHPLRELQECCHSMLRKYGYRRKCHRIEMMNRRDGRELVLVAVGDKYSLRILAIFPQK